MVEIRPTILEIPKEKIPSVLDEIKSFADSLHLDIADGEFVQRKNLFSPHLVSWIKEKYDFKIDMHLMVTSPLELVQTYSDVGADILSFHLEASNRPEEVLKKIKENGKLSCLALKLETDVALSKPYWEDLEEILLMGVDPGWGGQEFDDRVYDRISQLRELGWNGKIKIDGGIKVGTAQKAVQEGASVLVAGSALFDHGNILENYQNLLEGINNNPA
jgi:ribulose-phosphate 3-epimerase